MATETDATAATEPQTEEITITCRWETSHTVEVPLGWRPTARLDDFPEDVLEQLRCDTASLVDWE
jgi:hypothetical protein